MATQSSPPSALSPEPTQGLGRWVAALAVLVLLTEQSALGFALIAPALIGIATEFQTTQVIWVITIFTLVGGVSTPIIGKLGDRFGKRKVLVVTALVAFVGSVICVVAPSFAILLVGRAMMGVSTAFLPVTFALMRDVFPARIRGMSISIATNGVGVVTIAGPFLAGFLIDNISLDSVFWFVGLLSLVGALGTIALVPESTVRSRGSIDMVGAVGLAAGLLLVMYGISQLATWEFSDPRTVLTIGGGLVVLVGWWIFESRTADPFVDTRLLASRPVATTIGAYAFAGGAITVGASYLPTMLQTPRELGIDYGFGLSATGVARYFLLAGITTVLSGVLVGWLAKRTGFRFFLVVGPLVIGAGVLVLALLQSESWMPILGWGIVGVGAVVYAAGPNLLMVLSPPASRGVAAGMMGAVAAAVGSAFAQIAGLVLNRNVGAQGEGYAIYTAHGFQLVFLMAAGLCLVGFLIALAIPRTERQVAVEPAGAHAR